MDIHVLTRWCFMFAAISIGPVLLTSTTESSTSEEATTTTPSAVPGKVNNLETTLTTSTSIGLSWSASSSDVPFTQYVIFTSRGDRCVQAVYFLCPPNSEYYAGAHCNYNTVGTSLTYAECHGNMAYNVTKLESNTDYTVSVAATYKFIIGENSTVTAKTQIGIPASPTNIRGTALNHSTILIEWDVPSHNAGPMWYNLTLLMAFDRAADGYLTANEYKIEGQNSSSYVATDLLSSWQYMFAITASTKAGTSRMTTSKPVRTLPSTPGEVLNINVKYDHNQYLAVKLTWDCPLMTMRNGRITSYTISYTGNISMTLTAGSFYPEDPCTDPHAVYLPVIPDGTYAVQIWANAEFQGYKTSMIFETDREKMYYKDFNTTVSTTDPQHLIDVSAACGSIIAILIVVVIALVLTRPRSVSPKKRLTSDQGSF
ncbi:fibronectin type III domain-containing protein 1-like [Haliotis asinina]|uniref:fibronectin type III domain-containing protein 1-like n=1 Tax=Haliotis asinina TaxID=109174 RepID=UPI003531ECD7